MLVLFVVDVLCCALYLNDVCIGFVWKSLGNFAEPGNRCYGVKCCFSIEGYSDIILWFYGESSIVVDLWFSIFFTEYEQPESV